ncbi:MAG: response regulator [Leptospirales bacterium]|nr:response regulator [Leptospirales bacterium]
MSKPKILLVDDEPVVCGELSVYLNRKGFQVSAATSVDDALELFEHEAPDAVITDYNMPRKNGIDLLREVKARDKLIPVLMVSGESDVRIAVQALHEEAFDFIPKPVDPEALVKAIGAAIERLREVRALDGTRVMKALYHELGGSGESVSLLTFHRALDERIKQRLIEDIGNLLAKNVLRKKAILIFKNVDYINNVGFNALVEIVRNLRAQGIRLVSAQIPSSILNYITTLGYVEYFNVILNLDEAMAHLADK